MTFGEKFYRQIFKKVFIVPCFKINKSLTWELDRLVITGHGVYLLWGKSGVFRAVISHSLWLRRLSFFFPSFFWVAYSRGLFTGDEHCLHKGCAAFRPAGREIVRDSYLEAASSSSSGSPSYCELISQRQAFQSATSRHVTSHATALASLKTRGGTLKCEMRFLCPQDASIIDDRHVWWSRGIALFILVAFQLAPWFRE